MSAPLSYRSSCVPRAVAVVTGWTPERAAELLWHAGAARWNRDAGAWGTRWHVTADLLLRHGVATEMWGSAADRIFGATEYAVFLCAWSLAHVFPRRLQPTPSPTRRIQSVAADPDALTLAEWGERFPTGSWLVVVAMPPGLHALALVDGVVHGVGADACTLCPIIDALHVVPPGDSP